MARRTGGKSVLSSPNQIYYFTMLGLTVTYYLDSSQNQIDTYTSYQTLRREIRTFLSSYYDSYATIGHTDGRTFFINVTFLRNVRVSGSSLFFNYGAGDIEIQCIDSTYAAYHMQYLESLRINAEPEAFIGNRIVKKVDTRATTDSRYNIYRTYAEALTDSVAGRDIVIGVYGISNEQITLKDGVDIIFREGTGLSSSLYNGLFTDNSSIVNCNIYGRGVFTNSDSAEPSGNILRLYANSNVFFGFYTCSKSIQAFGIYTSAGKVRAKGHTLSALSSFDQDGVPTFADLDCLYFNGGASNVVNLATDVEETVIYRNIEFVSTVASGGAVYMANAAEQFIVDFIFCSIKNTTETGGGFELAYIATLRFWALYIQTTAGDSLIFPEDTTAVLYDKSIFTTVAAGGGVFTTSGAGTLTIDSSFTL